MRIQNCFVSCSRSLKFFDDLMTHTADYSSSDEVKTAVALLYQYVDQRHVAFKWHDKERKSIVEMLKITMNPNMSLPTFVALDLSRLPPDKHQTCQTSQYICNNAGAVGAAVWSYGNRGYSHGAGGFDEESWRDATLAESGGVGLCRWVYYCWTFHGNRWRCTCQASNHRADTEGWSLVTWSEWEKSYKKIVAGKSSNCKLQTVRT